MKINNLTPEPEILCELGKRLARIRKQQGFSQTRLAEEAGIGVATLRRIESGKDSQFESWLKISKALDMISAIDAFLPETFDSPMAEALASGARKRNRSGPSTGVVWGDESS